MSNFGVENQLSFRVLSAVTNSVVSEFGLGGSVCGTSSMTKMMCELVHHIPLFSLLK